MKFHLRKLFQATRDKSCGFTLIELLITLTIIGILTAIAVPQYQRYVARAFDTRAKLDLHNVAIAEEAYFAEAERYLDCNTSTCRQLPGITRISQGVTLEIKTSATGFSGTSKHLRGSRNFAWNSSEGGLKD